LRFDRSDQSDESDESDEEEAMAHDNRPSAYDRRNPDDPLGDKGRTSLLVVPPEPVQRAADAYRRKYHPAALERLPAHLTVIYPYAPVEAWPELLPGLEAVAASVAPFIVRLTSWGGGRGERDGGFGWLAADPGPFMAMRERFLAATPEAWRTAHGFQPHLTVGWFPDGEGFDAAWEAVRREPVDQEFLLDHLWLGSAGPRGVWTMYHRLDLGG
jgi:2'-5' RNA ligase